jgi:hypothetical protein
MCALTFTSCVLDRCYSRCTRIPARRPTVQDTRRCFASKASERPSVLKSSLDLQGPPVRTPVAFDDMSLPMHRA